jgi:hypothetical protein
VGAEEAQIVQALEVGRRIVADRGHDERLAAAGDDEAAFFATDSTLPALTGTAKYKDQMRGEDVTGSAVTIDLVGQKLSKEQVVALTNLLFFVNIVPMNDE